MQLTGPVGRRGWLGGAADRYASEFTTKYRSCSLFFFLGQETEDNGEGMKAYMLFLCLRYFPGSTNSC